MRRLLTLFALFLALLIPVESVAGPFMVLHKRGSAWSIDMAPEASIPLSVLALPSVSVDTDIIAETPVAPDAIALNVPAVPSVSASTIVKYAVTYNGNGNTGGTVPTDSNWYESGATVTVLGNTGTLVKTGYTWTCWNTQADGGGTDYNASETFELTAGTTLYAKWTAE